MARLRKNADLQETNEILKKTITIFTVRNPLVAAYLFAAVSRAVPSYEDG
jgi:hypothetical protein